MLRVPGWLFCGEKGHIPRPGPTIGAQQKLPQPVPLVPLSAPAEFPVSPQGQPGSAPRPARRTPAPGRGRCSCLEGERLSALVRQCSNRAQGRPQEPLHGGVREATNRGTWRMPVAFLRVISTETVLSFVPYSCSSQHMTLTAVSHVSCQYRRASYSGIILKWREAEA